MAVTPATFRACWMLLPWLPMARPIRSGLTTNSSWKDDTSCLELYADRTPSLDSLAACLKEHVFIPFQNERLGLCWAQLLSADQPPDAWLPHGCGTWAAAWSGCCAGACRWAKTRAWLWSHWWTGTEIQWLCTEDGCSSERGLKLVNIRKRHLPQSQVHWSQQNRKRGWPLRLS